LKDKWVLKVFIISFILSSIFSAVGNILSDINIIVLILILLLVILIGIIFDMIGVAVLTAEEAPFHARNSKKIKGANTCIKLLKNNTKVSSVCNDIVGDICGIVSGSLGAILTIYISNKTGLNIVIATVLITSLISSLTVGGKAYFKTIATKKSDKIILITGKILSVLKRKAS